MPNANYLAGSRKEYKLCRLLEQAGYLAARTAGSHSPVDVIYITELDIIAYWWGDPHSCLTASRWSRHWLLVSEPFTKSMTRFWQVCATEAEARRRAQAWADGTTWKKARERIEKRAKNKGGKI